LTSSTPVIDSSKLPTCDEKLLENAEAILVWYVCYNTMWILCCWRHVCRAW